MRLTEYIYYMHNNCTDEWMRLHFSHFEPTAQASAEKTAYRNNMNKERAKTKKKQETYYNE